MLPIKKNTPVQPGLYPAIFTHFDSLDPLPEHMSWNPTGKLKFVFKDVNSRIHEMMFTFPNYPAVMSGEAGKDTDDYKNAMTLSRECSKIMNQVYCLTEEEFNEFATAQNPESLIYPSDLANSLNVLCQQIEAEEEERYCDPQGSIIVHANRKGRTIPYTYGANEFVEGKLTHIILNEGGEYVGLGTTSVYKNTEYLNMGFATGEVDVENLDYLATADPVISDHSGFMAYPLAIEAHVPGWVFKAKVWDFSPFFAGKSSELTFHNSFSYKGEANIEAQVIRETEHGPRMFRLTSFNAG